MSFMGFTITFLICLFLEAIRLFAVKRLFSHSYKFFIISSLIIFLVIIPYSVVGDHEVAAADKVLYLVYMAALEFTLATLAWSFSSLEQKGSSVALSILMLAFLRFFMGYEISGFGFFADLNPRERAVLLSIVLIVLGILRSRLFKKSLKPN